MHSVQINQKTSHVSCTVNYFCMRIFQYYWNFTLNCDFQQKNKRGFSKATVNSNFFNQQTHDLVVSPAYRRRETMVTW